METVVSVVAVLIAVSSVLVTLGHVGYLALLRTAAHKRAGGSPIASYVDERWRLVGGTVAVSLVALLLTAGGSIAVNLIAIVLAAGSGTVAIRGLQSTQARYRIGNDAQRI